MPAMVQAFSRFLMAAMVLLAGVHCGCGSCFVDESPKSSAMAEMPCCQHELPAHDPAPPHHSTDHAMACAAGEPAVPVAGKDLTSASIFVAAPRQIAASANVQLAQLITLARDATPPGDTGTLLRLHCALIV